MRSLNFQLHLITVKTCGGVPTTTIDVLTNKTITKFCVVLDKLLSRFVLLLWNFRDIVVSMAIYVVLDNSHITLHNGSRWYISNVHNIVLCHGGMLICLQCGMVTWHYILVLIYLAGWLHENTSSCILHSPKVPKVWWLWLIEQTCSNRLVLYHTFLERSGNVLVLLKQEVYVARGICCNNLPCQRYAQIDLPSHQRCVVNFALSIHRS